MAASLDEIKAFCSQYKQNYVKVYPARFKTLSRFLQEIKNINLDKLKDINFERDNATNPIISDIKNILLQQENFEYIYEGLSHILEFSPVVLNNNATLDIQQIQKEKGVRNFRFAGSGFMFDKNVVMYDNNIDASFDFGDFRFAMLTNEVRAEPIGGNKSNGKIYHPYLSDRHSLCLGEYKEPYRLAMLAMRFFDAFIIVCSVMQIYGGDAKAGTNEGPRGVFIGWTGDRCTICDDLHPLDSSILCSITKRRICKKCVSTMKLKDEVTGLYYLPDYIDLCNECKKYRHNVRSSACPSCRAKKVGV